MKQQERMEQGCNRSRMGYNTCRDYAALKERVKYLEQLLQSLHSWFLKSAPEHYKGCGLYMDIADELRQEEQEDETEK